MQLCLCYEGMYEFPFFLVVFVAVKIKQVIYAQAMSGSYITVYRNVSLQCTGSSDTDDLQVRELRLDGACVEVDIYKRVKLIQYDINIVGAYAGRDDRNPFIT